MNEWDEGRRELSIKGRGDKSTAMVVRNSPESQEAKALLRTENQ